MAGTTEDDEAITGINVTPLVDITLVLLIIFMMTASFIVPPALEVELPRAATAEATPETTLALVLTRDGTLYLNGAKTTESEIRDQVRAAKRGEGELQAVIAADAAVAHGRVVALIDLVKAEGVTRIAINTEADFPKEPPPSEAPAEEAPR